MDNKNQNDESIVNNLEENWENKANDVNDNNKTEDKSSATEKVINAEGFLKTLFAAKRVLVVLVIIIVGTFLFINIKSSREGKIISAVSSVLKDVNVISEFSTLIIPYNSICRVEEEKKNETGKIRYKYYTVYDGTVFLGLDFNKIDISRGENEKNIVLKLPEITIIDSQVDYTSVETIYENEKYNTEGGFKDRLNECNNDLAEKAKADKHMYKLARESAEKSIEGLLKPIIEHIDSSYKIVFE